MIQVYNEEELAQRIQGWIKEYVPTILISLIIVVAIFFGWRYWQNHKVQQSAQASSLYEGLLISVSGKDYDALQAQADTLIGHYKYTPYAKLAALLLAKTEVERGNYRKAEYNLRWVMKNSKDKTVKQLARGRLARVLIAQKHPAEAIKILAVVEDKAYLPVVESIRGDAYLALGNTRQARSSYQAALKALPENAADWPLLQMKLNNVPAS